MASNVMSLPSVRPKISRTRRPYFSTSGTMTSRLLGAGGNADDEQCVQQEILPDASLEQVAGNEEAVVDVEYKEE